MTFGEKIKAARAELGYTQSDLARETGVCLQSIVNYEKGRVVPRPHTVMLLAEALKVSTRYLSDDSCEDPLSDIEREGFFQRAREEYRRKVRDDL